MSTPRKTFVRVAEIWRPDAAGTLLEFGAGHYADTRAFGAVSRTMCFGRGEGLPGRAWEERRPILMTSLQTGGFLRAQAAAADRLSCAFALPVFAGDALRAVVVLMAGDDESHVGAIELWHNKADAGPDLRLADGFYGGTAEVFEFISRNTAFRRGTGLPGLVWASGLPVFMPDLGQGSKFLRADSAQQVGINRGFALPCAVPGPDAYVVAFLSALATPLARRIEFWRPDDTRTSLRRGGGWCEVQGVLATAGEGGAADAVPLGQGVLGEAFACGTPGLAQPASDEPGVVGFAARGARLSAVLALPVITPRPGVSVEAVVAWYF